MPTHSLTATQAEDITSRVLGTVIDANHVAYEQARRVHNGLVDKRPALILQCQGTADVVQAIRFARDHDLPASVRAGGHNVAGRAIVDGGVVIDLSRMKGAHVDATARTVRVQAGLTWADFNRETQLFGLATTGGVVSSTGVAGLTLGGGLGWLFGRYGMAVDNLLSAEIVDAEGSVRQASEEQDRDLFWAIRGGGGNFGVATSLEFRLHPVSTVTAGIVAHPFSAARDVLSFYREFTADIPDELVVFAGLLHAPDGSGTKMAALVVCHCGSESDAERDLEPLRRFGSPIMDGIGRMSYEATNAMLDGGFPAGALNHWKSSFLGQLGDESIDCMIESFEECPSPMSSLLLEHFHGEATRVPATATAFPHRTPGYNLAVLSQWADPAVTDRCIAWSRGTYDGLSRFLGDGRYVNYLDDDEPADAVAAAYGPNLDRLVELKRKYDPTNFFRMNQNIVP